MPAPDVAVAHPGYISSPSPLIAEFVRRRSGLLAEKAREVRRIGESELFGNLVDRLRGENELALGFGEHALADEMTGGDAGRALDVVVEPIDRHAELFGIEAKQSLLAEKLVDQRAQLRNRGVGRMQGDAAGAGVAAASRATPTAMSTRSPRIASR